MTQRQTIHKTIQVNKNGKRHPQAVVFLREVNSNDSSKEVTCTLFSYGRTE